MSKEKTRQPQARIRGRGSETTCPFCREECAPEGSVACQDCLARHHTDCWTELGSCASCQGTDALVSGATPSELATEAQAAEPRERGAQVSLRRRAFVAAGWASLLLGLMTLVVSNTLLVEGHTALDVDGKPNPAFHGYLRRARARDGLAVGLLLLGTAALGAAKLRSMTSSVKEEEEEEEEAES